MHKESLSMIPRLLFIHTQKVYWQNTQTRRTSKQKKNLKPEHRINIFLTHVSMTTAPKQNFLICKTNNNTVRIVSINIFIVGKCAHKSKVHAKKENNTSLSWLNGVHKKNKNEINFSINTLCECTQWSHC